jgi:60 kDa SS-A/Ro ribonucleoprotein
MANKAIFKNTVWASNLTHNEAGGVAYRCTPKAALAQLASTSCLNNTLYCSAETQLGQVLQICQSVEPSFIAKTAIFAREQSHMKDMPALLCAILTAKKELDLLSKIFSRVIDNLDMVRNYVQIIRSGVTGRRSFGTRPKKILTNWFNCRTPTELFEQSVGKPSVNDLLKLIHPRPMDDKRSSLYAWFSGQKYNFDKLPEKVQAYENYKNGVHSELPDVPFEMLTSMTLTTAQWKIIAERAGWHWLRMNLNNMIKYEVFNRYPEMIDFVAKRLSDRKSILRSRVFPYQLMVAYQNASILLPLPIRQALQDALEVATEKVPVFEYDDKYQEPPVYLFVDVSKSMKWPITGQRYGSTTKVTSCDVAALIACALLRKNPKAELLAFRDSVVQLEINPLDTVMTNAKKISSIADGGTACWAPLHQLNEQNRNGNLVVIVSDNQSWKESLNIDRFGKKQSDNTRLQEEWELFKKRNPKARMVCLDIAPYTTTQVQEREDVLNIGGFSDAIFSLIYQFAKGEMSPSHWVGLIELISLDKY